MQLLIQRSLEALRDRQNLQKMGQIPGFLIKVREGMHFSQ